MSHEEFKRCLASGSAGPGIVYKLCHWEPVGPVILLVVPIDSKILFKPLIGTFQLSICLWVISSAEVLFYP